VSGFGITDGMTTSTAVTAAQMPALTGDITTSAGGVATTLATVNSNTGSFGSATATPVVTVNAKGLVTAVSTATVTPAWSSITSKPTTVAGYGITDGVTTAMVANAATFRAGTDNTNFLTANAVSTAQAFITLTDATTVAWDGSGGFNAKVTLGGNRTLGAITNPKEGCVYVLRIAQDGTGSRTLAWNTAYDFGAPGTPTLSTAASKEDIATIICTDAATPKFRVSFMKAA
jgi:hypothetical protein